MNVGCSFTVVILRAVYLLPMLAVMSCSTGDRLLIWPRSGLRSGTCERPERTDMHSLVYTQRKE